jgi:hypothetical protein
MIRYLLVLMVIIGNFFVQAESLPGKFVFSSITSPDSILIRQPIKVAVHIENTKDTLPVKWCGIISIKDTAFLDTSNHSPVVWCPRVTVNRIIYPLGGDINACFTNDIDTITLLFYNEGMYQIKLAVMSSNPKTTIFDSTLVLYVKQSMNQTSIDSKNPSTTLKTLHPFNIQVLTLNGKTVARYTNVTSYNLKSLKIPKGTYILKASTGVGNPMQRIINLFQ